MGKKKKEKKKRPFLKFLLVLLILAAFCLGSVAGYSIAKNGGGMQGVLATILRQDMEELQDLETINILLLGISEDLSSRLTDTIMVCSYNPKTQKASMLSIPRDTYIGTNKLKASGGDKINAVYASKGAKGTVNTVEQITGIDINYYVVVNNQIVIDLVDEIGGVYFDVPIDMNYDDKTQNLHIHLKAGYQKIDGEHAEQLLRFRHNNNGTSYPTEYGDNDYGRMKTQRNFMMAVAKQTLSLKNITKIKEITTTIFDNLETDLEIDDLLPYVPMAVNFDTENISSNQVPGKSATYNKLSFFEYSKSETEIVVADIETYLNTSINEQVVAASEE